MVGQRLQVLGVLEQHALPGPGRLMLDALNDPDYPVVLAVNLFFGTVVVFGNLLTDLLYASLDPRIRYE